MDALPDIDRIERLEYTLGTLITWLNGVSLNQAEVSRLIEILFTSKPSSPRQRTEPSPQSWKSR